MNNYFYIWFDHHRKYEAEDYGELVSPESVGMAVWFTALWWHAQSWVQTPTNACGLMIWKYGDGKDSAAILTSVQSAGVESEDLRITTGKKPCKQGFHPAFETQGICHKSQNRGISGLTKRTSAPSPNMKKRNMQYFISWMVFMFWYSVISSGLKLHWAAFTTNKMIQRKLPVKTEHSFLIFTSMTETSVLPWLHCNGILCKKESSHFVETDNFSCYSEVLLILHLIGVDWVVVSCTFWGYNTPTIEQSFVMFPPGS